MEGRLSRVSGKVCVNQMTLCKRVSVYVGKKTFFDKRKVV